MSELNKLDGGKKRVKKGRKVKRGGKFEPCNDDTECVETEYCQSLESSLDSTGECRARGGSSGGAKTKKYNGRDYVVRTGSRGGKYITVKGRKVYV
jgi:hypothetical protein